MSTTRQLVRGAVFGRWIVLGPSPYTGAYRRVICRCLCGKERSVIVHTLVMGGSRSCGCYNIDRKRMPRPSRVKDLSGQTFNGLTALSLSAPTRKWGNAVWLCLCVCGNHKEVRADRLKSGYPKSCGCLPNVGNTKHGMRGSREYTSWKSMMNRCTNPNANNYKDYGGRGITVCDRWLHSFENFYSDMGLRPPKHSLDRIEVNGNYEPGNCKWSTAKQQLDNRRCSKHATT